MTSIWIIEDNPNYRNAATRGLRAMDGSREVVTFGNCEDAIVAIDSGRHVDVLLMDIGLPGMDGIEGIGQIKSRLPNLSILVLTVFEDDDKIFRALQAGASGYLLKSESIANVSESVELVLTGAAPIHPRIAGRVLKMFAELAPMRTNSGQVDYHLNDRERQVLDCMTNGLQRKEIAKNLDLNYHTVDYILRRIFVKLHVTCATEAVALAIRERLLKTTPNQSNH